MGHLGQGDKITTVNTEKIVLTDNDGQNFTMEVSDLKHNLGMPTYREVSANFAYVGYGWIHSHRILKGGYACFDFMQEPFLDSSGVRAVKLSVFIHYSNVTPSPVAIIKVTTTGGKNYAMNNNKCSIAYKVDGDYLDVYIPNNANIQAKLLEIFNNGTALMKGIYEFSAISGLTLVPIEGI